MVAQVFNLCIRRLKPAATKDYLMIAHVVLKSHLFFSRQKIQGRALPANFAD